ncbi:uncharacterized protein [Miscanthus floridulus]|uniref:uncharacterized protein n=1 Tax=Miscanthus floridulus TaxID=154761 RepID=UPI00345AE7E6
MGATEVKKELKYKYGIEIPYQIVYNGTKRASDKLFGKWSDSFNWLYRFKVEIELRSPGTVVEIDTITDEDGKVRFSRFFCAFKASIDGFVNGCRPYISVDSTALNGTWNSHMPTALALDGHNWMFPVAFGFFNSETKDNWVWFMEQLRKSIGPMEKLAICTDACKGLESAVKIVFPQAEMRECFRHLMENMKKYYNGDVYGKNMWLAARAYSAHKFKFFFDKVLAASPDVQKWLTEHHPFLWARTSRGLGHLNISSGHPNQAEVTKVYKDEEVRRHVVKRIKKSNVQVGRKKANKDAAGDEAVTPRTRRALAREAAAKARRDVEEAELKATTARQAAEAAAREKIEATRNELSATHAREDVREALALEVDVLETTKARRNLFSEDELQIEPVKKMTPRKKKLAKKVRKNWELKMNRNIAFILLRA